jgi:dihydroxyacetone kinase-like predicted kinase
LPEPDEGEGPTPEQLEFVSHRHGGGGELDVSEQRYEVMYFLDLADERIEAFKEGWGAIGDSIVVVGGDGLWNCHVHTNDIGAAIETALALDGRPKQIRVTDLFEEIAEEHAAREVAIRAGAAAGLPPVTTAVVAVCSGEGLGELFANLRVQGIVSGGQTLNPSTAELLDTVGHVNADQVVILPNNKNIIPVAQQVDALTSKTVVVVPSRTMPEALAALIVYDPEAGAEENAEAMTEAIESVATGEVTRAVRDSSSEVGPIREGDWIGIVRGEGIASVGGSALDASIGLLERLITSERELLTIITGSEADADTTAAIEGWISDNHADVQVEVHAGGQPLYPYLFGVE